jgi:hypothetical protein
VGHFVRKEDAVAAARSRLQAELGRGRKAIFNPRLGFWWTGVDGKPPEQKFELRGPLGNAINELNIDLDIQLAKGFALDIPATSGLESKSGTSRLSCRVQIGGGLP